VSDKNLAAHGSRFRLLLDSGQPLTQELIATVNRTCDRIEDAVEDRVAVFELVGDLAGPSVSWPGEVGVHSVNRWERAVRRVEKLNAWTVAVVEGACSGPSLELLLATDHRIATPGSRFAIARQEGVTWPSMVLHRLVQQVGFAQARRLVLFGGEIDAEQAERCGLVDEVAGDPGEALARVLESLAPLASSEVRVRRQLLLEATTSSYEQALGVHLAACDRTLRRLDQPPDQQSVGF
jgi:isomerase DpgB